MNTADHFQGSENTAWACFPKAFIDTFEKRILNLSSSTQPY